MAVLTAHQPNFCPWMPFFEKMDQADVFVILSHVQYEKGGYQNRFYHDGWNTMSVKSGVTTISRKEYKTPLRDWQRILNKYPRFEALTKHAGLSLWLTNVTIIKKAADLLGINSMIRHDYTTELTGTDRLIDICKYWDCDTYLSGPSGKNYLDLDKFKKAGIEVKWFEAKDTRQLCEVL